MSVRKGKYAGSGISAGHSDRTSPGDPYKVQMQADEPSQNPGCNVNGGFGNRGMGWGLDKTNYSPPTPAASGNEYLNSKLGKWKGTGFGDNTAGW